MRPAPAGIPSGPDPPLEQLIALALDCQTTGPSAERDHLLEIGWVRIDPTSINGPSEPSAHLIALPDGIQMPPKVTQLTGVQDCDLKTASAPEQVWHALLKAAADLPVPVGGPGGVVLIHYARFETPFLKNLHAHCNPGCDLPFQIVCTHAIARRLLPHLPRCGLRALAGYFGDPVGERKRAGAHAAATRSIWNGLMPLLAADGIRKWSQLAAWLDSPPASGRVARIYPMPQPLRRDIPDTPGVYRMRRRNGDLLYVGKARSLRRRINSYFQAGSRHPEHILEMLTQAHGLDYTPTPTALEAALTEADLIKQAVPPYNIALKPRQVAPVYFAEDFQTAGAPGRPGFPVGPLPSERALAAFRFVVSWCGRIEPALPRHEDALAAAFDMPATYLPPRDVLEEGLNRYREICACAHDMPRTGRRLLRRGMVLWRQHQAARLEGKDDRDSAEEDALEDWNVPAVVTMLDGVIRRGSQLVRRGRWLQILANAHLRWETPSQESLTERTLRIRHGRIYPGPLSAEGWAVTMPPAPADARVTEGRIFTSAATYDRLRVLTTELRRLTKDGRRVRILPAVGGRLEHRGILRLLNLI